MIGLLMKRKALQISGTFPSDADWKSQRARFLFWNYAIGYTIDASAAEHTAVVLRDHDDVLWLGLAVVKEK